MIKISYAITAVNEHVELQRLLENLKQNIRLYYDEVVVQLDENATEEVKAVVDECEIIDHIITFPLNNDFACFKNNIIDHCTGDYIFSLDADEYVDPWLLKNLDSILDTNPEVEMYSVPRINTVEGLTEEHIMKWGWRVDQGRVNYPDYQNRIFRNIPNIKWVNKVHERITGYKFHTNLPLVDEMSIYHPKDITRQEKQNNYYETI
jgi:glycosyltransferase involved in cell wall biosynthesis